MNCINLAKRCTITILVLFVTVFITPLIVNAQNNGNGYGNNSNGNGKGNNGNGNGNGGNGNSVPVNNGIYLLAIAGVAFVAKKIYDVKKKQVVA